MTFDGKFVKDLWPQKPVSTALRRSEKVLYKSSLGD